MWQEERYDEALRRLDTAHRRRPDAAYFDRAKIECYRQHAIHFLASGDLAGALAVCEYARQRFSQRPDWLEAEAKLLSDHANQFSQDGEFESSLQCYDAALAQLSGNQWLVDNRRAAILQWAALAIQEKDYAEALRRYRRAVNEDSLDQPLVEHVRYGFHSWIHQLVSDGQSQKARQVLQEARTMMPNDDIWQEWQAVLDREFD